MKIIMKPMTIVLLVGVVCLLIGGALLLRGEVVDPFQSIPTCDTAETVPASTPTICAGNAICDRATYNRPKCAKESMLHSYPQEKHVTIVQGRPNAKQMKSLNIITRNTGASGGRPGSEGSGPTLNFSGIEIFQGGTIKCPSSINSSSCGEGADCSTYKQCQRAAPKVRGWPTIYHSDDRQGYHWVDYFYPKAQLIDKVVFYNRENYTTRAASYEIRVYQDDNTGRDATPIYKFPLTSSQEQTFTIDLGCPAGFTLTGDRYNVNTQCYQNCQAGFSYSNGVCYKPCDAGFILEGGNGGTCRRACQAGYTASGTQCYKNCSGTNIDAGNNQCYRRCAAADDDSRPPKCYGACPSTHRFALNNGKSRDDKCYPTDASKYLDLTWEGNVKPYSGDGTWCMHQRGDNEGADVVASPNACSTDKQNGTYMYGTKAGEIVNGWTRMCLDANNSEKLVWWPCHGGNNQKWTLTKKNQIESVANPGRCVTLTGMTPAPQRYRAYNYTEEDLARLEKGELEENICEEKGRIFTRGNGALAPGCGNTASCCAPVPTISSATIAPNSLVTMEKCDCLSANQIFNIPGRTVQPFTNPPPASAARTQLPANTPTQIDEEEGTEAFASSRIEGT